MWKYDNMPCHGILLTPTQWVSSDVVSFLNGSRHFVCIISSTLYTKDSNYSISN